MSEQLSIINLDALMNARLNDAPFRYMIIDDFLRAEYANSIQKHFPVLRSRGTIPFRNSNSGTFQRLVEELQSPALKTSIAKRFQIDLDDRSTMITVRGMASARDGRIYTDTKSKFLTMLLYLNPAWESSEGSLRILKNSKSLEDYVVEIPPTFGTCLLFKATENCWHGHKPFVGARKVLQLNYVTDDAALNRHLGRHRMTAKLKKFGQLVTRADN